MMQLELQTQATLDIVGTENYIRYGTVGPKRHIVGVTEPNPVPKSLTVQIRVAAAEQTTGRPVLENLILHRVRHITEQQTTWGIHDEVSHVQVVWVWDFYRMLSHFQVRLCIEDAATSSIFAALKELQPQMRLILDVDQQAGHIHQIHILTSAPQITDECL